MVSANDPSSTLVDAKLSKNKIGVDPSILSYNQNSVNDIEFKIIVLGNPGTGKSSIINSFLTEGPSAVVEKGVTPTEQMPKQVRMKDKNIISVKVWDSPGDVNSIPIVKSIC